MTQQSRKILKTIDEIRRYIGGESPIAKEKFRDFIRMGMPASQMGNVWYAHTDNIDDWFKKETFRHYKGAPDSLIDQAE